MKKFLLILGILLPIVLNVSASKYSVIMTKQRQNNPEKVTTPHRAPEKLPIEVVYDNETRQVEVTGDEEMAAQVYLSDENGNTLDSANSVNAVLTVPETYSGLLIIRVESAEWIATGKIAV